MPRCHILYWLWLSRAVTPGSKASDVLLEHFEENAQKIYEAGKEDYDALDLNDEVKARLMMKGSDEARAILRRCKEQNIRLLAYDDPEFPVRLKRIGKRPVLLYLKGGKIDLNDGLFIATVGTRRMTSYGERTAYTIAHDLCLAGATVVSGMALGVDAVCHRGALDAGGQTVAVLGCGVDIAYPKENLDLMLEIERNGLIVSEYPPGAKPSRYTFPQRNRIISGLCQGTLVVEADSGSGALITANYARSQGRDLFSLPGMVGEQNSEGTNALLREGAIPVTCAAELLSDYAALYPDKVFIERIPVFRSEALLTPVKSRFRKKAEKAAKSEKRAPARNEENGRNADADNAAHETPDTPGSGAEEEPFLPQSRRPVPRDLTGNAELLFRLLDGYSEPVTADELTEKSGMNASAVLTTLTILEIKGYATSLPGGRFVLT